MKWLLSIWTIYLMVLAAMPCSDAVNRCEDPSPVEQSAANTHDHNRDSNDNCTPFCYCSCCSVSMVSFDFKPFEATQPFEEYVSEKVLIRKYSFISNFYGNIWHPPKSIV